MQSNVELTSTGNLIEHGLISVPKYVGRVEIAPGFCIGLTKMPNKFHQIMHRIFFGWRYTKNDS